MGLYFYEASTNNVRVPPEGWFLVNGAAIQRWARAPLSSHATTPLTLNMTVNSTEARCLIDAAVANNPTDEILVCHREVQGSLRLLIFRTKERDLRQYCQWDEVPSWYLPASQIKSRYDLLSDDGVE